MPYSKKINLIRPWHCVIALGPANRFITFSQTQHFWLTCPSVAKMLLSPDVCGGAQEGQLPPAPPCSCFSLEMQFLPSTHKIHFYSTVFITLEWKSSYKPWHRQTSNTCLCLVLHTEPLLAPAASLPAALGFNLVSSHLAAFCGAAAAVPNRERCRTNGVCVLTALGPQNITALSYVQYQASRCRKQIVKCD